MDENFENFYKLTLAHDLIKFLMYLQNDGLSKDQKARRTNMILEAWEKRVTTKVAELAKQNIENVATATGEDADVLGIIQDIHTYEPHAIRKEFKREVRHIVFNSFDE